MADFVINSLFC